MSKYQLQVVFDRKDRTYRFNEEVSGKVVLDTRAQLTCRKIWIDYGWRTHGKGNQDKGVGSPLNLLSEAAQLRSGERREYPFRFRTPSGPATYHGHILNVDWYVTAHAHLDIPFRPNIKNEQDFLLGISMSKDELSSRPQDARIKLPADPDIQPGNPPKDPFLPKIFGGLGILLFLVAFFSSSLRYYAFSLLLGLFVAYLIYSYVFPAILRANWKRKFEISDLRITPAELYPGDRVTCRLQFQTKRKIYLDHFDATLSAEEVAISEGGSDRSEFKHVAYKQSYVKSYKENLIAGRLISFDCVLPVLPGAPATFVSSHNDIKWSVKVKISFNRWPGWEKTIPITVLRR